MAGNACAEVLRRAGLDPTDVSLDDRELIEGRDGGARGRGVAAPEQARRLRGSTPSSPWSVTSSAHISRPDRRRAAPAY